jgi:hypothetical protein
VGKPKVGKTRREPKESIETIIEELDREIKCLETTETTRSQLSKIKTSNCFESSNNACANTPLECTTPFTYPCIPNVQFVAEPSFLVPISCKRTARMTSPEINISYN